MSLNTRISITLIIFSLVMSASFRVYKFFSGMSSNKQSQEEFMPQGQDSLSVFENKLLDQSSPVEKMNIAVKEPDIAPAQTTSAGLVKPVFNPDAQGNTEAVPFPAPSADIQQQGPSAATSQEAKAINDNVIKYSQNPVMQAFTKDLQEALGPQASFSDVLSPGFDKKNANNPQVQKILLQYTKNPAFMQLMQQMMSDKDFMSAFEENVKAQQK